MRIFEIFNKNLQREEIIKLGFLQKSIISILIFSQQKGIVCRWAMQMLTFYENAKNWNLSYYNTQF